MELSSDKQLQKIFYRPIPKEPMVEPGPQNPCLYHQGGWQLQTKGSIHYRLTTTSCNSWSLLLRSLLSTPWVLPTVTQDYAAWRKEIKYAWLPGMKALVKIPSVKCFSSPFSYLPAFTPKTGPWGCCHAGLHSVREGALFRRSQLTERPPSIRVSLSAFKRPAYKHNF